jgi:hypothetical protein
MNMDCAEMMLKKAASLVLNKCIDFIYTKDVADEQVDLSYSFLLTENVQTRSWYSGAEQKALEHDLSSLDRSKVYFLRTGRNNRAGHWQTLYFDQSRNGWVNYSSKTNNYLLTQSETLTQQGLTLLTPKGAWGKNEGEYSMLVVEASPEVIVRAANYLYDYRMHGEAEAMKNGTREHKAFYDGISVVEPISATAKIVVNSAQEASRRLTVKLKEKIKNELDALYEGLQQLSKHRFKKWFLWLIPNDLYEKLNHYKTDNSAKTVLAVYEAFNQIGFLRRWLFSCLSVFANTDTVREYELFKKTNNFSISQFTIQHLVLDIHAELSASFANQVDTAQSEMASNPLEDSFEKDASTVLINKKKAQAIFTMFPPQSETVSREQPNYRP